MRFNDGGKTGVAPPLLSDVLIVWPWGEGRGSLKYARFPLHPSAAVVCCGLCLISFVLPPHLTYAASLHTRCFTVDRVSGWYHRRPRAVVHRRQSLSYHGPAVIITAIAASVCGGTDFFCVCTPPPFPPFPSPPFFFTVQHPA